MFRKLPGLQRVSLLGSLLLFLAIPVFGSTKTPAVTQDGVLVSFEEVSDGATCTGIYAANCQTIKARHYTVKVGEQNLVLEHVLSRADLRRNVGAGIWKPMPDQRSVLADQLPGVHFQVWSEKDGVHIRLGEKESLFQIVGARQAANE